MRAGRGPLGRILRIGAPDGPRFAFSTALGVAAALCTVGLLACSGALIDKAALRPPLYTLTVLMAAVQLLALARGPLRYAERLVSHDAALGALGRVRLWLYDQIAPRSPAGVAGWREGDLLARATADVDLLQDVYLRGVAPLLVAGVTALVTVAVVTLVLPAGGLVLAVFLLGGSAAASALAWFRRRHLGGGEGALRGELGADVVELLQAAPDLVAMGRDEEYLERALASDTALERRARHRSWSDGAVSALVVLCTGGAVIGLLAVSASAIAAHRMPAFMAAVLPLVALGAFEVVTPAADAVARIADHREAAGRLVAVADLPVPVRDPDVPAPLPDRSDVALEDAVLRYTPGGRKVLDGLSLAVPEGRRLAVVGPSGAGKSSIVNVLLRFWGLESGTARLGGPPSPTCPRTGSGAGSAGSARTPTSSPPPSPATSPWRDRAPPPRRSPGPPGGPSSARGSIRCPTAWTPRSASAGPGSPEASASGWRWPGPSWPGHRSWSSMSPRPGSTARRRGAWSTTSSPRRATPRSSTSPTGTRNSRRSTTWP